MKNKNGFSVVGLTAVAIAASLTLAACGGGGGSGSPSSSGTSSSGSTGSTSTTTPAAVTGTLTTPQYAADSVQLASFNLLNQYRQECGFPALQENTILDTAAQNHAKYMGLNDVLTDSEVSGSAGFTGVTYVDRAASAGFPSSAYGPGVSVTTSTTTGNFSALQYGQQSMYSLLGGVYHADIAAYPSNTVGIGEYETQVSSGSYQFTDSWLSLSLLNTQVQTLANAPLTFPCQGVTGVTYKEVGEIPSPPNVSSSGWGTPIVVMGNITDVIVLQTATVAGPSGNVAVQILNSATDPNKELNGYQAVAYPTAPLTPNTQYSVSLTGTVNGTAFSRSFTFSTGNIVG
ncbi:CAP domain-containing protein [Paraburkholderia domus]|uniref:CAP domain-containing protein n=1 Tax=Paraburkholderia domus TaxID=2793075 RepID=UPI0019148BBC|nr:CAP domain-containing protein [Paraburkholderia domus]MBK5064810.1 CAP domain-containing protein [Burkholderia sp. R-70199]CAE6956673.1 hypothetical protein R70199_07007 [Paraburkholderia domus]